MKIEITNIKIKDLDFFIFKTFKVLKYCFKIKAYNNKVYLYFYYYDDIKALNKAFSNYISNYNTLLSALFNDYFNYNPQSIKGVKTNVKRGLKQTPLKQTKQKGGYYEC